MQWWCHRCRGALAQLQHRPHTLGSRGRYPTSTRSSNPPPTDNADSAGLLVSHAAGATWSSLRDGLQTDDGPYHKVLSLSVPPNFGTDQTLFFLALGPLLPGVAGTLCRGCPMPTFGTFESNDGGVSWQVFGQPHVAACTPDLTLNVMSTI